MEQGPTFPWYEPSHLSVLLSNCVGCRGFPLPMGQSPLSPIDLHLQLFLRESAYLSYSSSRCSVFPRRYVVPCVAPSHSQFYFFFRPQRYLHPRFHENHPGFSGYREFAVHFIITLDGNKLSKRCACACNPGVRTR